MVENWTRDPLDTVQNFYHPTAIFSTILVFYFIFIISNMSIILCQFLKSDLKVPKYRTCVFILWCYHTLKLHNVSGGKSDNRSTGASCSRLSDVLSSISLESLRKTMKSLTQYGLCLNRDSKQETLKYRTKLPRRLKPVLWNSIIRKVKFVPESLILKKKIYQITWRSRKLGPPLD